MFKSMLPRLAKAGAVTSLALLVAACGQEEVVEKQVRPAIFVQPVPSGGVLETYPGEVRARYEPELAFRIGGKVARRLVEVGERVKKDQPLAELSAEDVNLRLQAAQAQLAAAEADMSLARSERDRYGKLVSRQLVSRSQFENAENVYKAAAARVKQMRAELDVAKNQNDYAILRSPSDGVISRRLVESGQVVGAGQTVFTLATDGEREVSINLPEQGIEAFKLGQEVGVELWTKPGKRFIGKLRELAPAADPVTRTYAARVAFSDNQVPAELGQSARVYFLIGESAGLAVPLSAVSAEEGAAYVFVLDAQTSTVKKTPVRLGAFSERLVPVLEGLSAADYVVAAGVQLLRDGLEVKPIDRENRPLNVSGPATVGEE
ncbi:membrane fusion protein, multidrug efflux system [Atopomonas hussainii]|uniref:Membrane fusion protein, multidrug efflux system n=1 Tax=Atopomonas hussainii TaxID=1429083 RepID=A0A1H7GRK4_9GAMM|nr:efflux RND transporter periplasmic adaptor subunit [Atopomonas hussainii]SEK40664.1 membrane fusion protein, multidrug efflux system [Atopomonas hussainii]